MQKSGKDAVVCTGFALDLITDREQRPGRIQDAAALQNRKQILTNCLQPSANGT